MYFKHPETFWYLFFLSIPILIHLIHFKKKKTTYFPNISFLKSIFIKQRQYKKIKNLVLLSVRMMYLTFLIFSFVQFFLNDKLSSNNKDHIIFIDNSLSMSLQGENGELFSRAKEDAIELIKNSKPNSYFQILSNDSHANYENKLNKNLAIKTIENLKISNKPFTLKNTTNLNHKKNCIYLFSDFQKTIASCDDKLKSTFNIYKYTPEKNDNLFIDSVWFTKPYHKYNENCELNFRLVNNSNNSFENLEIKISNNNSEKSIFTSIDKSSSKNIRYNFIEKSLKENKIEIKVNDLNAIFDNTFYFNYSLIKDIKILNVEGESSSKTVENIFKLEKTCTVKTISENNLKEDDFKNIDLAVINGVTSPTNYLIEKLSSLQKNNVNIILLPGKLNDEDLKSWNFLLPKLKLSNIKSISNEKNTVHEININDPFFKNVIKSSKQNVFVDYPIIKKSFDLSEKNYTSLISLKDKKPLLIKNLNKNTYLYCSSIDSSFSLIKSNAIYPIILLRIAELSVKNDVYYTFINSKNPLTIKLNQSFNSPFHLKKDQLEFYPQQTNSNNFLKMNLNEISEQNSLINSGFYDLKNKNTTLQTISLNSDIKESKLEYLNEKEIIAIFKPNNFNNLNPNLKPLKISKEKENNYWRVFLILSLILMFTEVLLIKLWKNN